MATSGNSAGSGFTDNDTGLGTYLGGDPSDPGNYSNYTGNRTTTTATPDPVVTTTTLPGVGATGASGFTQDQINAALQAELAARPGTTYADMVRYGTQQYDLTPQEVLRAYDAAQGSVTPYNQPTPGEIYSAAPTIYQPVRYTPEYDTYGQGIASLFGPGYSQYFQPPGATGVNYFDTTGGQGTVPTRTDAPGAWTTFNSAIGAPTGTANQPVPIIRPPTAPAGLTDAQAQQWLTLSPAEREQYLGFAQAYNDPGNVQSDAQLLQDYMTQNNLSAADVARITGVDVGTVNSYLGQAGLTDPQLQYYQSIGADQPMYADLAEAYNAPGDTQSDAQQMLGVMQENQLSAADVSRITGIPIADVNAYLALATPTQPAYEEPAAPAAPTYTTQDIAEAYRQSVGAGAATEAEFIDYARSKGVTDAELIAARDILLGR